MTTLYLSGPMTGKTDHNRPTFRFVAERLTLAGYDVINPGEQPDGLTWHEYLVNDVNAIIGHADALALLPGWHLSKGANLEHRVARAFNLPARMWYFYPSLVESR